MSAEGADRGVRALWSGLRRRAAELRDEVQTLALAARDPRMGWLPKAVIGLVVAYVLSPLDPIPDFIPVLGLLDELIVVPIGVALAVRLTSPEVLADARARYAAGARVVSRAGAVIVVTLWVVMVVVVGLIGWRLV